MIVKGLITIIVKIFISMRNYELFFSSGVYHTCALQDGGHLVCFGENESGQSSVPAGFEQNTLQVSAG